MNLVTQALKNISPLSLSLKTLSDTFELCKKIRLACAQIGLKLLVIQLKLGS